MIAPWACAIEFDDVGTVRQPVQGVDAGTCDAGSCGTTSGTSSAISTAASTGAGGQKLCSCLPDEGWQVGDCDDCSSDAAQESEEDCEARSCTIVKPADLKDGDVGDEKDKTCVWGT